MIKKMFRVSLAVAPVHPSGQRKTPFKKIKAQHELICWILKNQGKTYREIAERVGCSPPMARILVYRGGRIAQKWVHENEDRGFLK